jgi:hypothetical protein
MPGQERPGSAVARRDRPMIDRCPARVEEAPLCRLLVVGDHDIELTPVAPRQVPALQGRSLEAQQQRKQAIDEKDRRRAKAEANHRDIHDNHQNDPANQRQPQTVPGKPHHAKQRSPDVKTVANEGEAIRGPEIPVAGRRSVHCVNRHHHSPLRRKVSRRADPWSMALRPRSAGRWRPPPATPSPDP